MEDHNESNTLGVDIHLSHLCRKCGWSFPNPHPSAKHRRAHKRVCGKIEGHSQLTVVSDDDEDPLTPSPKPEKISEGKVFVDSVMEFSESRPQPLGKEAVVVVDDAIEQQLKVDEVEDCIEKPNTEKEGGLKHNLDVLETPENCLGRIPDAVLEESLSVAAPSFEKTCVEITAVMVAPSNINLESMEVQDFSTEVESHQQEDNSPDEEVNLEGGKEPEVIEFEKSSQNLSSFKDIILNGKDEKNGGVTMADDKIEILPPHNDDAELSSMADDGGGDDIAILTVSNIEKEGSLSHNLDGAPTNKLGKTAASEEIAFSDSTSAHEHGIQEFDIKRDINEIEYGTTITHNLGFMAEQSSKPIVEVPLQDLSSEIGMPHQEEEVCNLGSMKVKDFSAEVESHHEEEDTGPTDESVQFFQTKEEKVVNLEGGKYSEMEENLLIRKNEESGGVTMADGKLGRISMADAEFRSMADEDGGDAIAILTIPDTEKEGSLRHNLDETPINALENIPASEEIAFADATTSVHEHWIWEFDTERHIKEVEYGTETTHNQGFMEEKSSKPVVKVPHQEEEARNLGTMEMSHQEEEDNSPADDSIQVFHTKGDDSGLTVAEVFPNENNTTNNLNMIPQSDSLNQIEKVDDKKDDILLDGDITKINSSNLVPIPKLSRDDDDDEVEMISKIQSEMVMDKHLSEEPILSRDDETKMILQIPSEMMVVDKQISEHSIPNIHGNSSDNGAHTVMNEFLKTMESQSNHLPLAKHHQFDGSSSQGEDSVEAIWGSISVLSTQSEQLCFSTMPSQPDATDKLDDAFDPPSFMTLVEDKSEKQQKVQKPEQPKSQLVLPAAFPSLNNTNITKESAGRKKNEEIISKVANWSMPKQHTQLKNLIVSETHPNPSPNWKKQQQTEGENSSSKVLNSPATHSNTVDESKKGKRKGKGRPNWIQCVCCSSVH